MKKILDKVDRIRARGMATLALEKDSPFYRYNGNTFKLHSIQNPGYGCKVTLIIKFKKVQFDIREVL
jgi:hypothetical protein